MKPIDPPTMGTLWLLGNIDGEGIVAEGGAVGGAKALEELSAFSIFPEAEYDEKESAERKKERERVHAHVK